MWTSVVTGEKSTCLKSKRKEIWRGHRVKGEGGERKDDRKGEKPHCRVPGKRGSMWVGRGKKT